MVCYSWTLFDDLFSFFLNSAVFTWTNLLVVVVELDGNENEALDLIPLVTNTVSSFYYLIFSLGDSLEMWYLSEHP